MNRSNFWLLKSGPRCRRALVSAFILLGGLIAAGHAFAEDPAPAVPPEVDPPILAVEKAVPAPVDDVALNGPPPAETYALPPAPSQGGKEIYGGGAGITSAPKRFQWGVRLTVRGFWDDNILLSHFDRVSDYIFAIEPAITIGYGDIVARQDNYIRLDYAPSIFIYVDHADDDVMQQLIRMEGQYRLGRLTLGLAQDIQILHGSHLDTSTLDASAISIAGSINANVNGRTDVNLFRTVLGATYDLSDKTFLSGQGVVALQEFNTLISNQDYSGNLFFNYKFSPKLALGIGAGGGFLTADTGPDSWYEQGLLRATYQFTGKISLNAAAGVEVREFDSEPGFGTQSNRISGVYEIGAVYQPFDGTVITLRGSSRVLASAIVADADYLATNILLGVRQRVLQRVYLGFTFGYEHDNFFPTVNGVDSNASRDDNYFVIEPAVDVMVTRWFTVGAYYLYRTNDSSTDSRFSYYENQVGWRASFTY